MKKIVIDASVVLKWYLLDEEDGEKALELLNNYISENIIFVAPSLLAYEVLNGLIIAQKKGRIEESIAITSIEGFWDLEIIFKDISTCYYKARHYCKKYNRSLYDASYLAVAEEEKINFITADEKLYNSVKKKLHWVKWLGNI